MTGMIGADTVSSFERLRPACRKRCALLEDGLKSIFKPARSRTDLHTDRLCRRNSSGARMSSSYDNRASCSRDRKTRFIEHVNLETVLTEILHREIYDSVIGDGHAS